MQLNAGLLTTGTKLFKTMVISEGWPAAVLSERFPEIDMIGSSGRQRLAPWVASDTPRSSTSGIYSILRQCSAGCKTRKLGRFEGTLLSRRKNRFSIGFILT